MIDVRNLLAHQHDAVANDTVYGLVNSKLIINAEVEELLLEMFCAN